jgi:hypothetical protein
MGRPDGDLALKQFPVMVLHGLGGKRRGVGLEDLPKHLDLALQLFSLCHFTLDKSGHNDWPLRALRTPCTPDRGLLAPLNPNEEVTLPRVARGIAKPADLSLSDVGNTLDTIRTKVYLGRWTQF